MLNLLKLHWQFGEHQPAIELFGFAPVKENCPDMWMCFEEAAEIAGDNRLHIDRSIHAAWSHTLMRHIP